MAYTRVYPTRINWENEPSINTPINEVNLNKTDYALYQIDGTLAGWDTTKANQSDLLLSVKSVDYDTETGVFVFTWQNGTTKTVDLNIEKIPVSFSMSPAGVITMTTEDGTQYTADVGSLIKTYSFADSSVIDFTVTTDADGNKTVTADIVDGSITGQKLQPNYLADCQSAKTDAETAEGLAEDSAEDSEAWANGTRNGVPVTSSDPAYHNNSKYWSEQSNPTSLVGLTDTDINSPTNGQTLIYNSTSQKWENQNGGSASLAGLSDVDLTTPTDGQVLTYDLTNQEWVNADIGASGGSNITVTTTEATLYGQNVTISDGVTTLTETFSPSGVALFEGVTMTGQLTIASSTYSTTLNVPYFGNYEPILSGFTATIAVTFPSSSTCTCGKTGETPQTAYVSPHTFYVHSAGTYTITATDGTHTKSDTVTITTDGQSESVTLTYVPDGSTVLPTDDIQIWLNCADIYDKTTYTTLSDVLSDSTTLSTLINDNNAVDYMVRCKEWCGLGLVPKMTSDTTPSGVAFASEAYTGYEAYKAFDGDNSTGWYAGASSSTNQRIGYDFGRAVTISKVKVRPEYPSNVSRLKNINIQYSDDGTTWSGSNNFVVPNAGQDNEYTLTDTGSHRYWSMYVTDNYSSYNIGCTTLQFYGENLCDNSTFMSYVGLNNYASDTLLADSDWLNAIANSAYKESVLNLKNPTMTDNTHPSGVCSASSYATDCEPYKAFDGNSSTLWASSTSDVSNGELMYEFPSSVLIKLVKITAKYSGSLRLKTYSISATNDSTYTNLVPTVTLTNQNVTEYSHILDSNNTVYSKYKLGNMTTYQSDIEIVNVQFYGRQDV